MATTQHVDYLLAGDPVVARNTVEHALVARKFRVAWADPWTGSAERGSKVGNMLAGAFAQYMRVDIRLVDAGNGLTTVRVSKASTGAMGGALGVSKTRKNLASLRAELEAVFAGAGVLRGVTAHEK